MKNIIIKITLLACIMILPLLSAQLIAQPQPPFNHNQNGNQPPSGAPLDGGLSLIVLLSAAYGGRRLQLNKKKEK
ncbi:MAG: hypothetical protein NTZ33_05680 [Bacteroidetes bacterium]|nr:hypothetical protein [Bacteroidota bacterium]